MGGKGNHCNSRKIFKIWVFRIPTLRSISLISHILNKCTTFIFQGYNTLGGGSFLIFTRNKNAMTCSELSTMTACQRKQQGNPTATMPHEVPRVLHSRQEVLRDYFFYKCYIHSLQH